MGEENGLIRDLAAKGLQLEQSHISWVLLGRDEVWKIKKPVDFGYLDFSSPEKRRRACEAEVELNRRLSPEVYLGVAPVTVDAKGEHRLGGEGEAVEWAVHMVRLPESHRGDRRLASGTLSLEHLENLAGRLAAFHAAGAGGPPIDRYGAPEAVARNVAENFDQTRETLPRLLGPERAAELEGRLLGFVRAQGAAFEERVRRGRVRDGHGDLRLGQIYFDDEGGSTVLDCIEFNDRFRYGDVCSDISFLAMDLSVRGRRDLAENFLGAYARASGDFDLYALADFYESYRACVRGKIASYGAFDPGMPDPGREAAADEARAHFLFALEDRGRPAAEAPLIAVGGGLAAGKSTVAAALGRRLAAPVLVSDLIRKQMAGLDPMERRADGLWEGLYAPEVTDRVYAEIRRRAKLVLDSGRPVLVDASFRSREQRALLRETALRSGHPFLFLECRAGKDLRRERLLQRARGPGVSDGRAEILDGFQEAWEAEGEGDPADGLVLDTSRPLEESLDRVERRLGGR